MAQQVRIEDFLSTCEGILTRVEGVVSSPNQLKIELQSFENLLNTQWPEILSQLGEIQISDSDVTKLKNISSRIMQIEANCNTRLSLFDGMKEFVQRSTNR